MAKRYDKFTAPYAHSAIPFLVAEVLTNGSGDMVDLVCRWANAPAAACLDTTPEAMRNQRFCQNCAPERLEGLRPLADVAFSGSAASLSYKTALGRRLTVNCYQLFYGVCGCILDEQTSRDVPARSAAELLCDLLPAAAVVLEVGKQGIRSISFSQQLCQLAGCSQREFLGRFAGELTRLMEPEDRPGLLQCLLDAAQTGQTASHEFRLRQKDGTVRWVALLGEQLKARTSITFHAFLLDISRQKQAEAALLKGHREAERLRRQLKGLFDAMPQACALFFLPDGGKAPEPLQVSRGLARLLNSSPAELLQGLREDPLWYISPEDRGHLSVWMQDGGASLHQACRVRVPGGASRILNLSAQRREMPGGTLLVLSCTDAAPYQTDTPGRPEEGF